MASGCHLLPNQSQDALLHSACLHASRHAVSKQRGPPGGLCLLLQWVVGILHVFLYREDNLMVLRRAVRGTQDVGGQAGMAIPPRL